MVDCRPIQGTKWSLIWKELISLCTSFASQNPARLHKGLSQLDLTGVFRRDSDDTVPQRDDSRVRGQRPHTVPTSLSELLGQIVIPEATTVNRLYGLLTGVDGRLNGLLVPLFGC
jgi:hypothetical protein